MASVEIKFKDLRRFSNPTSSISSSILNHTPPLEIEATLKCMYLNATSLENKFDEFTVVVDTNRPNLIGVSETWFKNVSVVNMNGYNLYRKDRCDGRRGGGVCIYVDNSINSYEISDGYFGSSRIEQVWVVLYFGKEKYLIGCLYRPSDFVDMADFDIVFKQARKFVDKRGFKDILIMGDFNFPSMCWSNGSVSSIKSDNSIEQKFANTLNETFLYQHVNVPTFQMSNEVLTNTLDLIFTTESSNVCAIETKFVLGDINKGHLIIFFDYCLKNKVSHKINSYKYVYKKASFDKIPQFISNVDWVNLYKNKQVQEMYDELIYYSSVASNLFIPIIDVSLIKYTATP